MFQYFKYRFFIFGLLFCLFAGKISVRAQYSDRGKAQWIIINIAQNTIWSNEASIKRYVIAVYGYSSIYKELEKQADGGTPIKGKPYTVIQIRKMKDLSTSPHILFVPKTEMEKLQEIVDALPVNTLLITEECPVSMYMINFKPKSTEGSAIDINSKRAKAAGIIFNDNLISIAGKEEDLRRLTSKKGRELEKEKAELEEKIAELEQLEEEMNRLKKENEKEKAENLRQKQLYKKQTADIESQKVAIEEQRVHLEQVHEDLAVQQQKMNDNNKLLKNQEGKMLQQLEMVQKSKADLEKLDAEIEKNKNIIANKDTVISQQDDQIRFNRMAMIGFAILAISALVMSFFIWRGYKVKQKINDELRDKNLAINKQKEEITSQNQQTEMLNKELEKLSIVAAQTDNAVTIMDKNGNYEWVNIGYTRMYGYTLQLLINELDENVINVSTHEDIRNILNECISEKRTIVFETLNSTRQGKEIWVQTSLTPILDEEGEVSKIITVEIDISRIKKAEREIRIQHKKILEQTVQLEATNKELEKLSLVASETDNAISIMDAAGNFQWINEGYSRLYGYTFNQLVGEYSGNIITKDMNPEVKALIKQCIEKQVPVSYQNHRGTRQGKKIWVQTTLTPITDKEGNPRSIISISQDISELKNAEQAIRQQSEELMAQKEELIWQKDQIETQNENIRASISYAKTIQSAILPPERTLNQYFDSFIIYKPKDIVSGDFYWHTYLPSKNGGNGKHFIAAVDCTGHGVPGAFMSMIGSRLLNEIVREKKIDHPSFILTEMDNQIKRILRQEENENNDGMDVCLCTLENITNGTTKMVFAGAKRPLYFYRSSEQSLKYIKGTRKTIGGTQAKRNQEVFTDHEVLLEKGDLLYLTTDGIIDQPSSERIRFGSLRFINLLREIGSQPVEMQKDTIEQAMVEYQGSEQQRDDVTFIGVKV